MHKLKFVSYSPVNLSYVNFIISPSTRTQEWWMQKFLPPWQWHTFLYGSHWERKSTRGIWTMGSESRGIQSKSVSLSLICRAPKKTYGKKLRNITKCLNSAGNTAFSPAISAKTITPQWSCAALMESMVLQHSVRCAAFQALPTLPTKVLISNVTVLIV